MSNRSPNHYLKRKPDHFSRNRFSHIEWLRLDVEDNIPDVHPGGHRPDPDLHFHRLLPQGLITGDIDPIIPDFAGDWGFTADPNLIGLHDCGFVNFAPRSYYDWGFVPAIQDAPDITSDFGGDWRFVIEAVSLPIYDCGSVTFSPSHSYDWGLVTDPAH